MCDAQGNTYIVDRMESVNPKRQDQPQSMMLKYTMLMWDIRV
jgi:hypothetical protein